MKALYVKTERLASEPTLRFDVDYQRSRKTRTRESYVFADLFELVSDSAIDSGDLTESFLYCEIGDADKNGDIMPVSLNFDNRNMFDENYYKKIESGDIMHVATDDILVPKVRPNLKKFVRITSSNESIYFTRAFITLRPKAMPALLYYALRSLFFDDIVAISRQGKGYPTLSESDLRSLQFDKQQIDLLRTQSDNLTAQISAIEQEIATLKAQIKSPQLIIDEVFAQEFELSVDRLTTISNSQCLNVAWSNLFFNNSNLRFSSRWNKAGLIQEALLDMSALFKPLGKYIIKTRNGYSPECSESASMYGVLGIDALSKDTLLRFDNLKYTDSPIPNAQIHTVQNGDFFISRGNTTDLVALASIAELGDDVEEVIYPDLMIKIEFTPSINRRYMAYVFNSFIGRLYFKHATKGKNQTMVKVSSKELYDFYVPLPLLDEQQRIVDLIRSEIAKQDEIKAYIADLRRQIDKIIEGALTETHTANWEV